MIIGMVKRKIEREKEELKMEVEETVAEVEL